MPAEVKIIIFLQHITNVFLSLNYSLIFVIIYMLLYTNVMLLLCGFHG
jgi:hypothetical protein